LTDGSSTSVSHPSLAYSNAISNGVSAGQANRAWQSVSRTLGNGAN